MAKSAAFGFDFNLKRCFCWYAFVDNVPSSCPNDQHPLRIFVTKVSFVDTLFTSNVWLKDLVMSCDVINLWMFFSFRWRPVILEWFSDKNRTIAAFDDVPYSYGLTPQIWQCPWPCVVFRQNLQLKSWIWPDVHRFWFIFNHYMNNCFTRYTIFQSVDIQVTIYIHFGSIKGPVAYDIWSGISVSMIIFWFSIQIVDAHGVRDEWAIHASCQWVWVRVLVF